MGRSVSRKSETMIAPRDLLLHKTTHSHWQQREQRYTRKRQRREKTDKRANNDLNDCCRSASAALSFSADGPAAAAAASHRSSLSVPLSPRPPPPPPRRPEPEKQSHSRLPIWDRCHRRASLSLRGKSNACSLIDFGSQMSLVVLNDSAFPARTHSIQADCPSL